MKNVEKGKGAWVQSTEFAQVHFHSQTENKQTNKSRKIESEK